MRKNLRKNLISAFLLAFILVFSMAMFSACAGSYSGLHIEAPERVEADLGIYRIPEYPVVDASGAVYSGSANAELKVKVKSVKDQNNNEVELTGNTVNVREPGDWEFVYGVDGRGISDVVVTVAFADRTAPTITLDGKLPDMYIVGNVYSMPLYSLAGDYVIDRCYAKLYLADDEEGTNLTELQLDGNAFEVTQAQKGKYYLLRFHAEDAAGNVNEYNYYRPVDGPDTVLENTVIYFNDAFGARQVEPQESYYQGEVVSAEAAQEAGVPALTEMPSETGYYKLSFSGDQETTNNEGYLCVESPAITDIRSYTSLEFWVYFDPGEKDTQSVIVGMPWWGDTTVNSKEWTKVSFNVQNWGGGNGDPTDRYNDAVLRADISGMRLRFLWGYSETVLPHGTFYLSRMTAVPGEVSNIVCEDDRVWTNELTYYIGQTVTLSAEDAGPGETFDCFFVDGKPISGNTFVATEKEHEVTVQYIEGELTASNMTWGERFTDVRPLLVTAQAGYLNENLITAYTAGSDRYWALSFDVTGGFTADASNQKFGVSIYFGNTRTVEFQITGTDGSYKGTFNHYGNGKYEKIADLSAALVDAFKNASDQNPVHIDAVRLGDYLHVYVNEEYFSHITIPGLTMYGDYFGYAWRKETKVATPNANPTIKNAKAVTGETKATAAFESFSDEVKITAQGGAGTEKDTYRMGEIVKLIADPAPEGKAFSHFTVDGARITGDTFVALKSEYTVAAVYGVAVNVTFADGVTYEGGLYEGATIKLGYTGTVPSGKVLSHFTLDGAPINGNTLTLGTGMAGKEIAAVFTDPADARWTEVESYETVGSDAKAFKIGTDTHWALSYTAQLDSSGWVYTAAYVGGSSQLLGFELAGSSNNKLAAYGSCYDTFVELSDEIQTILRNSSTTPVTIIYVRNGEEISVYLECEATTYLVGTVSFSKFGVSGNDFGIGERNGPVNATLSDISYVTGETKVEAWLNETMTSTITTDENTTPDKNSYVLGETVTLTAEQTLDGQTLRYFTVDGKRIEGNTFVASKSAHTVAAVYDTPVNVTFADGVTYEGELYEDATIKLDYTGTVPSGQVLSHFTIGDTEINGNELKLTAEMAGQTIAAVFTDPADARWTKVEYTAPTDTIDSWGVYYKLGSDANWIVSYEMTATNGKAANNSDNAWYVGVLYRPGQLIGYEMGSYGTNKLGSAGTTGGTWDSMSSLTQEVIDILNGASVGEPVTLYFVRQGNTLSAYIECNSFVYCVVKDKTHTAFDEQYGLDFGYGWRTDSGGIPTIQNIRYLTGEEKVEAWLNENMTSTITKDDNTTTDKDSYALGETVTLTAKDAPEGKEFSHFTVDGERIEGNTFVATKSEYTVAAVYGETSTLTLTGVRTADEQTVYARGATVTLELDGEAPAGQVFDGFFVDNKFIPGNTFVTSAATHTVTAKFVSTAEELTWANDDSAEESSLSWSNGYYQFSGTLVESSKYWVVQATVNFPADIDFSDWYNVAFAVGSDAMVQLRFHKSGGLVIQSMGSNLSDGTALKTITGEDLTAILDACKTSVTITMIRMNNTYRIFFNEELLWESDSVEFKASDDRFGMGSITCEWLTKTAEVSYTFITGEGKTQLYLDALQQQVQ